MCIRAATRRASPGPARLKRPQRTQPRPKRPGACPRCPSFLFTGAPRRRVHRRRTVSMSTWLLPENIADVLPSEARKIEELRRHLLDRFRVYGYEMVMPPLLEYLESLLTGGGHDLNLRTFKLVDQLSGRTMGLRADITPQVARIDAHLLNRAGVVRLCYCGSVLHTLSAGLNATREPLLIGAELYGHGGIESDIEIVRLLTTALAACGVPEPRIDLGHVGVFRALARHASLAAD